MKKWTYKQFIIRTLTNIQVEVGLRNSINLYDINIHLEDFFRGLLNITYDYELQNLNHLNKNVSAIDLADEVNKVAIQVTSDNSSTKINETIKTFTQNEYEKKYERLFFLIIGEKKDYRSNFFIPGLNFDKKSDIIDIKDLIRKINSLEIEKLEKIIEFFNRELENHYTKFADTIIPISIIDENSFKQEVSNNHILDKLYKSFYRFQELRVLPPNTISQLYPIIDTEDGSSYLDKYTLIIDSEDVFNFLNSLKRAEKEVEFIDEEVLKDVENYKMKTKYILEFLHNNLVFYIEKEKRSERISIDKLVYFSTCNCITCNYNRLNFLESNNGLSNNNLDDFNESLKNAYIHYQFGNFKIAYDLYSSLAAICEGKEKYFGHFICLYNLTKLRNLIRGHYFGENRDIMLSKIEEIDLYKELNILPISDDKKDILKWIIEEKFIFNSSINIDKVLLELKEDYRSDQWGGWSTTQRIQELIRPLIRSNVFINSNYIIYDAFGEYHTFIDKSLEGLFLSHSIKSKHSTGKLEYINDYVLKIIIFYSNPESLKKTISRYFHNTSIKYKSNKDNSDTKFYELVFNFLNDKQFQNSLIQNSDDNKNFFFEQKYNKIFGNIMIVISSIALEKEQLKQINLLLIDFISRPNFLHSFNISNINYFVKRKGDFFDLKELNLYFDFLLNNKKFHGDSIMEIILEKINKNYPDYTLSEVQISNMLNVYSSSKCNICGYQHKLSSLIFGSKISDNKNFAEEIEKSLENEFNLNLAFEAILNDVIPYEKYLDKIIGLISTNATTFRSEFDKDEDKRISYFEKLMVVVYKYNLNLKEQRFKKYFSIQIDYYQWLLDPEGFDYSKFKVDWVTEYYSKYFFYRFKSISQIVSLVKETLKNDFNNLKLSNIYINYLT